MENLVKQLPAIAHGWFNFIHGTPEIKQMMEYRLRICDNCPHKKQLSTAGKLIVTTINQQASTYLCKECGCPLAGKTAGPNARCPLGKWEAWKTPDTYY